MKHRQIIIIAAVILALGTLILSSCARAQQSVPQHAPGMIQTGVTEGVPTVVEAPSTGEPKRSIPKLEDPLAQIVAAYRAGDEARLATFAGERHVDLKNNTVRVILEMDISPDAHAAGGPTAESVTLPDGRTVQVQHAPPIAIRSDLAQAIAATGATFETASQDWVQVLAPFGSLEALTSIPGVRFVRLPYAAQP